MREYDKFWEQDRNQQIQQPECHQAVAGFGGDSVSLLSCVPRLGWRIERRAAFHMDASAGITRVHCGKPVLLRQWDAHYRKLAALQNTHARLPYEAGSSYLSWFHCSSGLFGSDKLDPFTNFAQSWAGRVWLFLLLKDCLFLTDNSLCWKGMFSGDPLPTQPTDPCGLFE